MVMSNAEADALVKQELGEGYCSVKMSGYYFIYHLPTHRTITPATSGRRKLELAIIDARGIINQEGRS